jgi:hypothetical protein
MVQISVPAPSPARVRVQCRAFARSSRNLPAPGAACFGELDPPAPVADFEKRDPAEINLMQCRQVLPIEHVFPNPVDPGADLGIYRSKGECRGGPRVEHDRQGLRPSIFWKFTGSKRLISRKQLADRAEKFHFRAPPFGLPLGLAPRRCCSCARSENCRCCAGSPRPFPATIAGTRSFTVPIADRGPGYRVRWRPHADPALADR